MPDSKIEVYVWGWHEDTTPDEPMWLCEIESPKFYTNVACGLMAKSIAGIVKKGGEVFVLVNELGVSQDWIEPLRAIVAEAKKE